MAQLFANNASSTIASAVSGGATTITVTTGHGTRFPSPSGGDYARLTLQYQTTTSIIQYTGRSGDTLTGVTWGIESSDTNDFPAGSKIQLRLTAGAVTNMVQQGEPIDTAGEDFTTDGGAVDTNGGAVTTGGGLLDTEGGNVNTGGGDLAEIDTISFGSGGAPAVAGDLRRNGTALEFHDGTAARALAVLAGVGAVGLRLAATSTAEATTATGSAADIKTITVSATTSEMLLLVASLRKTAGAAAAAEVGLKVNSTQVFSNQAWTSAADAAQSGLMLVFIGRQTANYLKAAGGLVFNGTVTPNILDVDTNMPGAAITSLTITGSSDSASVTMGVADAFVYRFVMA